ncbi:MAG TPA: hypothetical protein VFM31_10075 [Nitrososphaeraceae archaeon]|jgi:hypothetical protein|nr:hypothetical protein [Nitrososphaeraceae archaeon]HJT82886.1 hypothetical protein [Nitrososphaeraceae archaeon]
MPDKTKKNNESNNNDDDKKKRSYLDVTRKRRSKNIKTIILPIIAVVAIIAVISIFLYSPNLPPSGFGALGSAHTHAAFLVKVNGENIDFSQPKYQVQSDYIHVENGDGTTLHRHATNVTFAEFLKSIKMDLDETNNCLVFTNGTQYCNNENNQLRTFVNGNSTEPISDYVINDNDRLLVMYGNETQDQVSKALDELNKIKIQFT